MMQSLLPQFFRKTRSLQPKGLGRDWIADYKKLMERKRKELGNWKKKGRPRPISFRDLSAQRVPKTLWIFWDKGWEAAPPIVRLCHQQWQKMNPGWDIRFLDTKTACEAADLDLDFYAKKFRWSHIADILRIALLNKHGGVWADAAYWCNRPLDHWIPVAAMSGFFAFDQPTPDRMIASNFLAASLNNPLVREFHQAVQIWANQAEGVKNYFWFHDMFNFLYNHNDDVRRIWDATPKIPARLPIFGVEDMNLPKEACPENFYDLIQAKTSPVHYLRARHNDVLKRKHEIDPENFANTPLAALLGRDSLANTHNQETPPILKPVPLQSAFDKSPPPQNKLGSDWIDDFEQFALMKKRRRLKWVEQGRPQPISFRDLSAQRVPKILWIFWDKGWEAAPPIVRLCHQQWQKMNPGWDIRFLDKKAACEAADIDIDFYARKFRWSHIADILRIALLNKHGGVWTDAAIWCNRPLDHWIPVAAMSGFFAFERPGPDRMINSSFLAASLNNPLVREFHKAVQIWANQEESIDFYYWFHYMFNFLYDHNDDARRIWDATPKIQAYLPILGAKKMHLPKEKCPENFYDLIQAKTSPVHYLKARHNDVLKRTHRIDPENFAGTPLAALIGRDSLT